MPFYYNKQIFYDLDNRQKCLVTLDVKTFDQMTPLSQEEMYMLNCNIGAFLSYGTGTVINAFLQGSVSTTTVFYLYAPDIADVAYSGFDLIHYILGPFALIDELQYNIQGSTDNVNVTHVYINPCTILAIKSVSDDNKTLVTMRGGSVLINYKFDDFLNLLTDPI